MSFPERLAIATRNAGKIREITRICSDWPVDWLAWDETRDWPEVEETGDTYLDNALLKARAIAEAEGIPGIADDSGIEVDALGGGPGPRSARYAGEGASDEANLKELLRAVAGVPAGGRTARYRCVAAIAYPGGQESHSEATCEGMLIDKPRGTRGFGYDPVFVPEGWSETMAELTDEQKDRISHRGRAFRALRKEIAKQP